MLPSEHTRPSSVALAVTPHQTAGSHQTVGREDTSSESCGLYVLCPRHKSGDRTNVICSVYKRIPHAINISNHPLVPGHRTGGLMKSAAGDSFQVLFMHLMIERTGIVLQFSQNVSSPLVLYQCCDYAR